MRRLKKYAGWLIAVGLLSAGGLFWHMGSSDYARTVSLHASAIRSSQRASDLHQEMKVKLTSQTHTHPVVEETAMVLSRMRRDAVEDGVRFNQVTIRGHVRRASNGLQNLKSAAQPAKKLPGLHRISVKIAANWSSLDGLTRLLKSLHRSPVRITSLDIGQGFVSMEIYVYGVE